MERLKSKRAIIELWDKKEDRIVKSKEVPSHRGYLEVVSNRCMEDLLLMPFSGQRLHLFHSSE